MFIRLVGGTLDGHRLDHVATAHEGLHLLEDTSGRTKKGSNTGGAAHFVGGESHEIRAKCIEVNALMRNTLSGVDEDLGAGLVSRGE